MYRLERTDFVKTPYISLWAVLAFQAGFINAFGFIAFGKFVSHVTGFGSQIGVAFAERNLWFAIQLLGFPISFILGAFVSGLFTSARIEKGFKPRYDIVTALLPITIFCVLVFCLLGTFGEFQEPMVNQRDFNLLFLLSCICGMQNGCFATMTKGQIRTTHLTGISTDIGTDFARLWFGKLSGQERELTRLTNISRIVTFCFFAFGSISSVIFTNYFNFMSILIPLLTSILVFIAVRSIGKMLDQRFSEEVEKERKLKLLSA